MEKKKPGCASKHTPGLRKLLTPKSITNKNVQIYEIKIKRKSHFSMSP